MPIAIYSLDKSGEGVASLAPDDWNLASQTEVLSKWLETSTDELQPGNYIADIGFTHRSDATGGGGALEPSALGRMAKLGMALLLSEYASESSD